MKHEKPISPTNLSPDVIDAVCRLGRKQALRTILKSVLFWAVALTALFVTERQNDFFTRQTEPFWFTFVLLLLVLFPLFVWKPHRIFTERAFRGTIVSTRNKRAVDHAGESAKGPYFDSGKPDVIDIYIIKVKDGRGRKRTFAIKRANARFGRFYYQKGDVLFCPRFAHLPFNESRPLPLPYCLWCGSLGTLDEVTCSFCKSPYAAVPEDGAFTPVPFNAPEKPNTQ